MIHRSTTGIIRAALDNDPNPCGTGPTDETSTLNRAIARYGLTAVGDALRPEPTPDGKPAHRRPQ